MTKRSGPGKSYRKGTSLIEVVKRFNTEEKAEGVVHSATLAQRHSLSQVR